MVSLALLRGSLQRTNLNKITAIQKMMTVSILEQYHDWLVNLDFVEPKTKHVKIESAVAMINIVSISLKSINNVKMQGIKDTTPHKIKAANVIKPLTTGSSSIGFTPLISANNNFKYA